MKKELSHSLASADSFEKAYDSVLEVFRVFREEHGSDRIGLVSGIISSDGDEHIAKNIQTLQEHTERIRDVYGFPVFSSPDIFSLDLVKRLEIMELPRLQREETMRRFFKDLLASGFISDVFMTPRWEFSEGATDEYNLAIEFGLAVHLETD